MPNQYVIQRLKGIQQVLNGIHEAGKGLSNATRGSEREQFVNNFLAATFPPPFRFGRGDITDRQGSRSGQVDVVVEYPFLPSLPSIGHAQDRLYFAEGVAAVIEVKSDLSVQWGEARSKANKLKLLRREFGTSAMITMGVEPSPGIPILAVGYKGWKTVDTVAAKVNEANIHGILVIEPGIFCSSEAFGSMRLIGPEALLGFISCLHMAISSLKATSANLIDYLR